MKIYMIRHGMTSGNIEKRYIGRTDEPLCEEGIKELKMLDYPQCDMIICSPMIRCIQTAELLFHSQEINIVHDFRECDFGDFEGKNYGELEDSSDYQKWIDSNGEMQFPNGEKPKEFKERCCEAFIRISESMQRLDSVAMVVHGGTIMSILEKFAIPHKNYYEWNVPNGHGYLCEYDREKIKVLKKL